MLEAATFEAGEVTFGSGDILSIVTDGVTEAMAPTSSDEFGDGRVLSVLREVRGRSAQATLDALVGAVGAWTGTAGCSDDLTVLTLRAT